MEKNYNILVTAYASVLVIGASSPEEAMQLATDQVSFGDLEMDEASVKEEVSADDLANSLRHADCVVTA